MLGLCAVSNYKEGVLHPINKGLKMEINNIVKVLGIDAFLGKSLYGGTIIGLLDDSILILAPKETETRLNWSEAIEYCSKLSSNGYQDWRLPSKDELKEVYNNKDVLDSKEAFVEDSYWSSSEFSSTNAWKQYFYNGNQYNGIKTTAYYVRAVRSIKL